MPARALLLLMLWVVAPLAARAQSGDPLKSPECGRAVEQLQTARAAKPADAARVEALRHSAAKTCLGAGEPPARAARVTRAPIAVPPPQIQVPARPPVLAAPALPQAPLQIDRPPRLSSCDTAGCWVDDGTRLQRVPPNMMAPSGLCAGAPGAPGCP